MTEPKKEIDEAQIDRQLKHLDAMNLHARNCMLDSIKIAKSEAHTESNTIDDVFDRLKEQAKFHFGHQRDNQATYVGAILHGLDVRRFTDGNGGRK